MEYRLLIVKNRYKKKLNFKTGLDWFAEHTPLKIVVDELETDFDFTYKEVGNGTFKGTVPKDYAKLTSVVPRGKYHAVVLVLGNNVPGVRVSITEDVPLYPDTEFITLVKVTDGGKTLNHELIHAIFKTLARKGIKLDDKMDTYLNDNSLSASVSNRTMCLEILKPYWNQLFMKPTQVTITRDKSTDKETTGSLVATSGGATFTCKTLELPWKNNASNISCIPPGEYDVSFTRSIKFPFGSYEVKNVPSRTGIRLHKGNYAFKLKGLPDIQGCILLGKEYNDINNDNVVDIINSTVTVKSFEDFMQRKPFKLYIK